MQCAECGAVLPGEETCIGRFHTLLGAEYHSEEAAHMHGLPVLPFPLQHPSRTRPWYSVAGYDAMRRIFGTGRDKEWLQVLYEIQERQEMRGAHEFTRWKASVGPELPADIVTPPVSGELTVADIDPAMP